MTQRKTVHRLFWVWNFEQEEQWLNEMAQSGWLLDGVGFCTYHFIPCEPGTYTVRQEQHEADENYLEFMQETGAEYVGRMVQWVYFRKRTALGSFDLFSDLDSRIAHLDRVGNTLLLLGIANLVIGLTNTFQPTVRLGWINLLCATLLMYALGRIHGKKEALQQKRLLTE